jgi:predicted DNA-binding transcriptional regulator YafY
MKRPERLHDMMRYLNNREYFNLQDLMDEYSISKSTALRDIESLEQLGMPIYSEHGRNGGYGILKNSLLSPISFTMDEVYALYFAMLTLEAYESTPFHLNIRKLHEKFKRCLSENQQKQIQRMKKVLQFEVIPHKHASLFLDKILKSILNESSCTILYSKHGQRKPIQVQFYKISARFGQWYASGMELSACRHRVFRCDRIEGVEEMEIRPPFTLDELLARSADIYRLEQSIPYEVEISAQAKDLFYKEHYPSMTLEEGESPVIRGFYNPGEEAFTAAYFTRFGTHVLSVKPDPLKQLIRDHLNSLLRHYQGL